MEKVSVIMPCYNDGEYIEEAIESIFNQTYKNIELIVIDDGSDDEKTIQVLNSISSKHIKMIKTKHLRPAGARNEGIKESTGKYIMPVDSDDKIDPTYIEKSVDFLEKNKEYGVVYCRADLFGEKTGVWELPNYSLDQMLLDNIVFVTALFYKEDWEAIGGFNTLMHNGMEDYDFWLSIIERGKKIHQIPEILFHYRIKQVSRTTEFQKNCETVKETYRILYNQHPKFYKQNRDEYAKILRDNLIELIFVNRALKEQILFFEKLEKFPLLKKIIRKFIIR